MPEWFKPIVGKQIGGSFKKKIYKKIKNLLPFESLWGHREHASNIFCSALRDGKLLLIQENKAFHCHYQQKKKKKAETLMNTLLRALWQ